MAAESKASEQENLLQFHQVPENVPVSILECKTAFDNLTAKEKLYAHYLSRASWAGTKIVTNQVSEESPLLFDFFVQMFGTASSVGELRKHCLSKGEISQKEWDAVTTYVAQFFDNSGNYLSFGDSKFIPSIPIERFSAVVAAAASFPAASASLVETWKGLAPKVYSLEPKERSLGFPEKGVSSYYSSNVSKQDMENVGEWMVKQQLSPYNTRLFKTQDGPKPIFELRVAAGRQEAASSHNEEFGTVNVVYGDYDGVLARVASYIAKARPYSANAQQDEMLKAYEKSFSQGHIDDHKEAQRQWVRDIGPVVETNIGFIESYRDPLGVRGEWEGFVAVVNKETSKKFGDLVDNAKKYLPKLPWPPAFEKDEFKKPDFTALEVISFAGSGIPAGINIPNYDDIRQNFGFKNVSLANVLSAKAPAAEVTFIKKDLADMFTKLKGPSFEVQVGCHELLGHGSGKLFMQDADGKFNFDTSTVNPLTGKPVESWYKPGQTYDSQFGAMGSSYEECRAECVGILLSADYEMLRIFGHTEEKEATDVMYINWLNMVRAGVLALEFYSPETQKWRQAHMQARYGILRTLLAAGGDFVKLSFGDNDALVEMDKAKIQSVGVPAINDFLRKIQIYKATADVAKAKVMYDDITSVSDDYLKLRDIVLAKKQPRKLFVQVHTTLDASGNVVLHEYPATTEGLIDASVQRFKDVYSEQL